MYKLSVTQSMDRITKYVMNLYKTYTKILFILNTIVISRVNYIKQKCILLNTECVCILN